MIILRIYQILWWLLLPVIVVLRLWRDWRSPLGLQNFQDRFGFQQLPKVDLIIHAVSLGEVRAVTPLVKRLLAEKPSLRILFTATTLTGSDQIQRTFKQALAEAQLFHTYLPFDFGPSITSFLKRTSPKAILIMETEIWPNLFYQAEKRNIEVIMISACLSDRSFYRYQKIRQTIRNLLKPVIVLTQTDEDSLRFELLGAGNAKRMGNIKYDLEVDPSVFEQRDQLKALQLPDSLYWMGASTHEEEEEIIVEAFIEARKKSPHLKLIIAPRHPERFPEVKTLLEEYADAHNFTLSIRSHGALDALNPRADIWLIDTMGELLLFYAFADMALVGGSFVPIGGHNILEPAYFAKPIIVGPYMDENRETLEQFLENRAIMQVNSETLESTIIALSQDKAMREAYGNAAHQTMMQNQGAIEIVLAKIDSLF
ncbi:3-deoxy-D-manno-octulosonic acid transferase [Ignatzschineria ureiclastica]|uniref:3-deoxy-D-manno-octulosonic acid transferase n=1 Tax=Ignatzschineria ureiclastica TaxID=472582 RepID=A0A2U2AE08_9GAMM|nr:3-deoxy-D-manno-octulosonic acid transferase [Ignatzschineria ureiclastica]PWD80891.1 3-deoxy-D-manno-octulosonic acid transferase [Ignatzschineria ureiclastica]GGZ94092.1 3-deoxy-D-manno-octulosonic acid transferase [Ignatzschineria ureiclastica]